MSGFHSCAPCGAQQRLIQIYDMIHGFHSCAPCGAQLDEYLKALNIAKTVSIHALRAERNIPGLADIIEEIMVSIHALRAERNRIRNPWTR